MKYPCEHKKWKPHSGISAKCTDCGVKTPYYFLSQKAFKDLIESLPQKPKK